MDVDESRRDCETASVDLLGTRSLDARRNRSDTRSRDCHIELASFSPGTVEHRSTANDEIVIGPSEKKCGRAGESVQCASARRDEGSSDRKSTRLNSSH